MKSRNLGHRPPSALNPLSMQTAAIKCNSSSALTSAVMNAPDELQKQVADLALAVNRLCGIVSRMSKGDKDAGVPF